MNQTPTTTHTRSTQPLEIGVCSWSLQVKSIPELVTWCDELGVSLVQLATGDPHHASWEEGDNLVPVVKETSLKLGGAMVGFAGEDYTSPKTIEQTGGFGDPATRADRLEHFKWAVNRTIELGLADIMGHGGFLPEKDDPGRASFLDTLGQAGQIAADAGVIFSLETGQETAERLLGVLDDLKHPNIKVNFDPANMLLYDMGEPIKALEKLAPHIRSVHAKDAKRPTVAGQWGDEVPLGRGQANIPAFIKTLKSVGYTGPIFIEREVGNQQERARDIAHGIRYLRECLAD